MNPLSRRAALAALTAGAASWALPRHAAASLALALTLPELTQRSARIVRGTPVESDSVWERLGGRRRIVTYTRVLVTEPVGHDDDDTPELLVRCLGGRVGDVAQHVHGAAALRRDEASLLFLTGEREGARGVTGLAQGHYTVEHTVEGGAKLERLRRSPVLAELVRREDAAVDRLHHLAWPRAASAIRALRRRGRP